MLPESPRWLHSQKRFHEAREVFKRIAEGNRAEVPVGLINVETRPTMTSRSSLRQDEHDNSSFVERLSARVQ